MAGARRPGQPVGRPARPNRRRSRGDAGGDGAQPQRGVRGAARRAAPRLRPGPGQLAADRRRGRLPAHRFGRRPADLRSRAGGDGGRGDPVGVDRTGGRRPTGGPPARPRRRGRAPAGRVLGRRTGRPGLRCPADVHLGHHRAAQGRAQRTVRGRRSDRADPPTARLRRSDAPGPRPRRQPAGRPVVSLGPALLRPAPTAARGAADRPPPVRGQAAAAHHRRRPGQRHPPGADPLRPAAPAARGRPRPFLRRLVVGGLARRGPVLDRAQATDARLVGRLSDRVLRRDRGRRGDADRRRRGPHPPGERRSGPLPVAAGRRRRPGATAAARRGGPGLRQPPTWFRLPRGAGEDRGRAPGCRHLHLRRARLSRRRRLST